ncbi:glycoside hydrolase family 115 protein, partial [Moniliophthora roreri]
PILQRGLPITQYTTVLNGRRTMNISPPGMAVNRKDDGSSMTTHQDQVDRPASPMNKRQYGGTQRLLASTHRIAPRIMHCMNCSPLIRPNDDIDPLQTNEKVNHFLPQG